MKYLKTVGSSIHSDVLALASDLRSSGPYFFVNTAMSQVILSSYEEIAPHKICSYIYDVCNAFNRFYHETRILAEEDRAKKEGWIALLCLTLRVLETCIDLLGFSAPEKM